ncbi:MAG: Rpn family recombination-promoting nuclease/putative transposase [Alkalinema sp. RU_4_3]|nr:Rpn family recombination-promoting nuclease/putative transposase [Alkalinema sp. RU_4_3]
METDSLFYRLFQEKPKLIFELLGEKVPRTIYTFGSYEIKQTSLRADGVLQPKSPNSPIVFVEAQGYSTLKNKFYPSFFAKICMFLHDYEPPNDWRAVILFTKRKYDTGVPHHYREFDTSDRLQRIYLDEMPVEIADCSLEVGLIQLFGLNKQSAFDRASEILHQTQQRTSDAIEQQRVLEWIVTVFVHKFPKLSREEIKTMLGTKVELRKTRFYQEIEEETYSKVIPILLESGMSISDIAKRLDISVKRARAIASSGIEV